MFCVRRRDTYASAYAFASAAACLALLLLALTPTTSLFGSLEIETLGL